MLFGRQTSVNEEGKESGRDNSAQRTPIVGQRSRPHPPPRSRLTWLVHRRLQVGIHGWRAAGSHGQQGRRNGVGEVERAAQPAALVAEARWKRKGEAAKEERRQ